MNMLKTVLLTALLVSVSYAQFQATLSKTGTTAAQFLKIGVGPRAIGMGGAYTTAYGDVNTLYWNPAGIARVYSREASFSHIDWLMDVNLDHTALAVGVPEIGTIGAFVSVLSMGEMPVRTVEKPEGTGEYFSSGSIAIGIAYARNLTDNFAIGCNIKYLREYIWNESASGMAVDIGTLYTIPFLNEFRIAASISNFGTKMRMAGRDILILTTQGGTQGNTINTQLEMEEYDLPLLFRLGVSAEAFRTEDSKLNIAIDAVHPNDNTESVNAGAEYAWNEFLFVRAGYKSLFERNAEQGLTLGFGVNYLVADAVKLLLDYAYQDFGRLNNVHHISLGVRF